VFLFFWCFVGLFFFFFVAVGFFLCFWVGWGGVFLGCVFFRFFFFFFCFLLVPGMGLRVFFFLGLWGSVGLSSLRLIPLPYPFLFSAATRRILSLCHLAPSDSSLCLDTRLFYALYSTRPPPSGDSTLFKCLSLRALDVAPSIPTALNFIRRH